MNRVVTHVLVGVASAGAGFAIGYLVSKKRTERYIDQEIASVKEAYSNAPWRNKPDLEDLVARHTQEQNQISADRTVVENLLIQSGYSYHEVEDGDRVSISGIGGMDDQEAIAHVDEYGRITLNPIDEDGNEIIPPEPPIEFLETQGEPTPEEADDRFDNLDIPTVEKTPSTQNLWADRAIGGVSIDEDVEDEVDEFNDPESVPLTGSAQRAADVLNDAVSDMSATLNPDADAMPPADPDRPYIITVDQFLTDGIHEDDKVSLIYFEEDDILADERGVQERQVELNIGEANLHKFGVGSRDPLIVYIRNDKLGVDYEIVKEEGSYTELVLGQKPPRETRGPLRMRENDE